MQELNRFKVDINLAEFATIFGYYPDKDKSSSNAPVMRHENGDKIIVGKDKADNHYIYFNPNNDSDNGSIIDFVKNRTGETLGHIRKRLRSWLRNPQPQENIPVKASTKDALRIANIWTNIKEGGGEFDRYWGLSHTTLYAMQNWRNVKRGEDNSYYFALSSVSGICGIEKRTVDRQKHIIRGSEKGVFVQGDIKRAERIVIFESPIDMASYMEIRGEVYAEDAFYLCTMGSIGKVAEEAIEAVLNHNKSAKVIVAVDNDAGGDTISEKVADIIEKVDGSLDRAKREVPHGKDWNDDLIAIKRQQEDEQHITQGVKR